MKVYKIGNYKNSANDLKIKDDSVSYSQAEIELISKETLKITNLSNTNITKINGRRISVKEIGATDQVEFGYSRMTGQDILDMIQQNGQKDRIDFSKEFRELENTFKSHRNDVKGLQGGFKTKVNLTKVAMSLVLIAIGYTFVPQLSMGIFIIAGAISMLVTDKLFSSDDHKMQVQTLREEYSLKLVCPKCKYELMNKSYSFWSNQKRCKKCHAIWVR